MIKKMSLMHALEKKKYSFETQQEDTGYSESSHFHMPLQGHCISRADWLWG